MTRQNTKSGFTLIELTIVIAILAVTAYFGTAYFTSFSTRASLDSTSKRISSYLQQARSKSMAQEDGKAWEIRFGKDASGDFYQLCWEDGDCQAKIYLPSEVKFKDNIEGKKIQFTKLYGSLSENSTIDKVKLSSSKVETLNIIYVNKE